MKRFARVLVMMCAAPVFGASPQNEDDMSAPASEEAAPATDALEVSAAVPVEPAPAEATAVEETAVKEPAAMEPSPSPETAEAALTPAEPAMPAYQGPSEVHKVVKGDTLWNIAGAYLKDPFQWTKIWEVNKSSIPNPDLIYPDQEFVVPSLSAVEALAASSPTLEAPAAALPPEDAVPAMESETVAETAMPMKAAASLPARAPIASAPVPVPEVEAEDVPEAEAVPVGRVKATAVSGAGFMGGTADTLLAGPDWEYDGYILRDREQKIMISQGDVVYVNVGASAGIEPRMTAHVYRLGKKVNDPFLKKDAGKMLKRVGTIMVTGQVSDEGCTAVVLASMEPIHVGDLIKFAAR